MVGEVDKAELLGGGTHMPVKLILKDGTQAVFKPFLKDKDKRAGRREQIADRMLRRLGWGDNYASFFTGETKQDITAHGHGRAEDLKSGTQGSFQEFKAGSDLKSIIDGIKDPSALNLIRKVNPDDVVKAAQFDFLIWMTDRNPGNVLVTEEGRVVLIDNGHTLRNVEADPETKQTPRQIGTVFIPGATFGKSLAAHKTLKNMVYTTHVDRIGTNLDKDIRRFVDEIDKGGESFAKTEYDLNDREATDLVRRSRNLKNMGFERALSSEMDLYRSSRKRG